MDGVPEDVRGLRVLVVGINYAPEHTGIAPYTTQACDYFAAQGAQVHVLAGVPHYPHWSVPSAYRWRVRVDEQRGRVRVRRLRHHVPSKQSAWTRALYESSFAANVVAQPLPWRPDVVLAVVPTLLSGAAAALIARRKGARFVVWVQDLMGPGAAQSGIRGGVGVAGFAGAVEGRVMRGADEVVVLNDAFRRYAEKSGVAPDRITIQPNWTHITPPHTERSEVRSRLGWRDDEVIALHSGNMGLKQGLENVVAAARLAHRRHHAVRFVLMGDGSQRAELERAGAGIPTLQFLPPSNDADFPDVLAAADVLLVNERASAVDMSLPSKLTSYFRAGRPVISAVHPAGGTASEVRRSEAGLVTAPEDPAALLTAVRGLCGDRKAYEEMTAASTRYANLHLDAYQALGALTGALTRVPAPAPGARVVIDLNERPVVTQVIDTATAIEA